MSRSLTNMAVSNLNARTSHSLAAPVQVDMASLSAPWEVVTIIKSAMFTSSARQSRTAITESESRPSLALQVPSQGSHIKTSPFPGSESMEL